MDNVVTPETARKLKAAGFPQPMPEVGQVWYENDDTPVIMCHTDIVGLVWGNNNALYGVAASEVITYAPTAPDILKELGDDYHIGMLNGVFVAGLHQFGRSDLQFNDNPAEACAEAWIDTQP